MASKKKVTRGARSGRRGCSIEAARRIALSMPGAHEEPHFELASFRVNKKIFATLWEDEKRVMVKLTPDQQEEREGDARFRPVEGYWGMVGATFLDLTAADEGVVREAMKLAWRNAAPKKMVKELDQGAR